MFGTEIIDHYRELIVNENQYVLTYIDRQCSDIIKTKQSLTMLYSFSLQVFLFLLYHNQSMNVSHVLDINLNLRHDIKSEELVLLFLLTLVCLRQLCWDINASFVLWKREIWTQKLFIVLKYKRHIRQVRMFYCMSEQC